MAGINRDLRVFIFEISSKFEKMITPKVGY